MITEADIRALSAVRSSTPIVSCYLDVDGARYVRPADYERALEAMMRRARERNGGADVSADLGRVEARVKEGFDRGVVRGVAIFACAEQKLFEVFELPVSVRNELVVNRTAAVGQLEVVVQQSEKVGGARRRQGQRPGARLPARRADRASRAHRRPRSRLRHGRRARSRWRRAPPRGAGPSAPATRRRARLGGVPVGEVRPPGGRRRRAGAVRARGGPAPLPRASGSVAGSTSPPTPPMPTSAVRRSTPSATSSAPARPSSSTSCGLPSVPTGGAWPV